MEVARVRALETGMVEAEAGGVGGMVGGVLHQYSLRAGTIPPTLWASVRGTGSTMPLADAQRLVQTRGLMSPYGGGAVVIGSGSGYAQGVYRRGVMENQDLVDAGFGALEDGGMGALYATFTAVANPTTYRYWQVRRSSTHAGNVESWSDKSQRHHQRSRAAYPELDPLTGTNRSLLIKLNQWMVQGNTQNPRYMFGTDGAQHKAYHYQWRFGQRGSYSRISTHGPFTPATIVLFPTPIALNQNYRANS